MPEDSQDEARPLREGEGHLEASGRGKAVAGLDRICREKAAAMWRTARRGPEHPSRSDHREATGQVQAENGASGREAAREWRCRFKRLRI